MLVAVTLLRFRSALGKWAPDSIAETTLFNVTTVPWKFSIICYVAPSAFMTGNPSSSKLYVNLYFSFMTHGSHEMSSLYSQVPEHVWRIQNHSLTHVWVDTLHVNHMPLFLCPCVRRQVHGSQQQFAFKAAYPPSIARGPSGVTEWRLLVALCPLPAWKSHLCALLCLLFQREHRHTHWSKI